MIEMKVSFDTDRERAMQDTRYWAALALSPRREDRRRGPARDGAAGRRAAGRARRQALDRLDRPRRACRADGRDIDLGFSHLVFHAPGPDQRRFLDLYADQVAPRLRARYGCEGMLRRR